MRQARPLFSIRLGAGGELEDVRVMRLRAPGDSPREDSYLPGQLSMSGNLMRLSNKTFGFEDEALQTLEFRFASGGPAAPACCAPQTCGLRSLLCFLNFATICPCFHPRRVMVPPTLPPHEPPPAANCKHLGWELVSRLVGIYAVRGWVTWAALARLLS